MGGERSRVTAGSYTAGSCNPIMPTDLRPVSECCSSKYSAGKDKAVPPQVLNEALGHFRITLLA